MKRLLSIILCLMLLSCGMAEGLSKEESYSAALELLYDMDAESLNDACAFLEYAGNYKLAKQYLLYARALKCIAEGDTEAGSLDYAELYLEQLGSVEAFATELSERGYASCGDLLVYVRARKLEQLGSAQEAMDLYAQIPLVLDSMERQIAIKSSGRQAEYDSAMALYNAGQYYEAAQIFKNLNWLDSGSMYNKALSLHVHAFSPATCEAPATCKVCGETEGQALGHSWINATCTAPKTCSVCGKIEGEALGHDWLPATQERPETCSRCGMTRGEKLSTYAVGDIYTFGNYEQDDVTTNGKEPIEWIILDMNEDGSLVLLSKYALDCKPYKTEYKDVTWETCTLRKWLNEDFYNAAFNDQEKAKIVPVTLENEDNPNYGTTGGKATIDNVWLLSIDEVKNGFASEKVYSYFTDDASRMCAPTKYAVAQGAWQSSDYTVDGVGACKWWLRSLGSDLRHAASADFGGFVYFAGYFASYGNISVRPVVCVLP